ncbi:MAG TPA: metallophosphoesterase family protein [Burkholderiales bacterium]|nr:metallophosphoesterase family protein [Burkholderiales bacterium]
MEIFGPIERKRCLRIMLRLRRRWALIPMIIGDAMTWLKRWTTSGREKPKVGRNKRVYAVGDIHGRLDLLDDLLDRIVSHSEAAPANNVLVFLGDYIDRGANSQGVIERLVSIRKYLPGWKVVPLRGNHEQAALQFLGDPNFYCNWRSYGAAETLLSYGVMPPRFAREADYIRARDDFASKCPHEHLQFISQLQHYHVEDDYLFVHAGVRPGVALWDQLPEDLLSIREDFLLHRKNFGRMIVHGHTPAPLPVKLPNRICIDTGAHATGRLTAIVLEGENQSFLDVATNERSPSVLHHLAAMGL